MKIFFKSILGVLLALTCLSATQIHATNPASILVEATKTVIAVGEDNVLYVTLTNPGNSSITDMKVTVVVPAEMTVNSSNPSSGTAYNVGTGVWESTTPGVGFTVPAESSRTLSIAVTQTSGQGQIETPTATITAGSVGVGLNSSIQILVGCPILVWGTEEGQVRINKGNVVPMNDATPNYLENLAAQGVDVVFSGFRKNADAGATEYTANFVNNTQGAALGQVLQFQNASPKSDPSGNAPWLVITPDGSLVPTIDTSKVVSDPANYLEGVFTFDPATYVTGVNGLSFFVYDIDAFKSAQNKGWQDGIIVFGTDVDGNMIMPVTTRSQITTVYDIPTMSSYSMNIGGKGGLVNYTQDNPRGRVTYQFPDKIRSFTIRYFRNGITNSSHVVWLSSLYRGCGTDLELDLDIAPAINCQQCFSYVVHAKNNGPDNDVGLAQVSGVVPVGLNFVSAVPSQGSFDPVTNKWLVGSLTVGQEETLMVNVCATDDSAIFDMELLGDGEETVPGNNVVNQVVPITYIVVQNDAAATAFETPVQIQWDANDSSVGGTLLPGTFSVISSPDGTVTIVSPGVIEFTPNTGFSGTAVVHYSVSDSNACTGEAYINILVDSGPVTGPIALPNFALSDPNSFVVIDVLANDIPGTGALVPSSVTVTTPPIFGTATPNPDGTITYVPNPGFCGLDIFMYQVCDTNVLCASAQVVVNVVCPPKAMNDAVITPMNTPVAIDVKANDISTSFPLDPTTVSIINAPSNGSVVVDPLTGVVTYTPNNFFTGLDIFTYRICDTNTPTNACSQATVFVTVEPLVKPCPTDFNSDSCLDACFDRVDQCLCTPTSFAEFTPTSGMWSQVADYVTVSAPAVTYNYLRYDTTVDQTHEIIEVELTFPQGQINTPFVSAGIVSHWNGADPANGASEVYITFQYNNVTGVGNARMIVETHGGSFTQANIPQINLGQTYTLRIVKNLQQTVVYLDDVQIMTDLNSGSIPGNYIGLFALGATVQFKNFTSCSYSTPVGVFAVH